MHLMFDNTASRKLNAYQKQTRVSRNQLGFTIVELLIVIVVIAILAAIIIAVYNGLQTRAADSVLRSDLSNAAKQLGLDNATNGVYPGSESAANEGKGLPKSPGTDYRYDYIAADNSYCLTAFSSRAGVPAYHISTNNNAIQDGPCTGHVVPVVGGGSEDGAVVSTLAGSGEEGHADGTGLGAQFKLPISIAVDSSGNLYVADISSNRIRKITPSGVVTTLAGSGEIGYADGSSINAQFNAPSGVAVDNSGNVYVADTGNDRIRKITPSGVVTTLAGSGVFGYADGAGTSASFRAPYGIVLDSSGNLYVADQFNHRIRKITPAGVVTTLAGSGIRSFADGSGVSAQFNIPSGVAVDNSDNVYVADNGNHRIRKITPSGVVTTLAGSGVEGYADGTGAGAQFSYPAGVALDNSGNVYVADTDNHRIRKITPSGVVTTLAGSGVEGYADGTGAGAQFNFPISMIIDNNNLYVADYRNHRIRVVQLR